MVGALILATLAACGENAPRQAWSLADDAKPLVAEMKDAAKAYRRLSPKTYVLPRHQMKYSSHRPDLIHGWWERALDQDSSWAPTMPKGVLMHPEAWKSSVRDLGLGAMDGFAVCITQSGRDQVLDLSRLPGGECPILVELPYDYNDTGLDSLIAVADRAWAMPNAFRLDGRIVLTRYPAVKEAELARCAELRARLAEKYGPDRFIIMFYFNPFDAPLPRGPLSAADLEAARAHLRRCLRMTDGVMLGNYPETFNPRRYGAAFERDVMAPLFQSVLAEPEFAGRKRFAFTVAAGHENCYRWSHSIDSQGTRTLAERLKTVLAMRPDFIIPCEWDELNENTLFQPSLFNGFVHQRLLRWFADADAGRGPGIFPGDDPSVPNLVVSYRKSVAVGEPIEAEVRNIPDGTFRGGRFTVEFLWRRTDGSVVRRFAPATLGADELKSAWFTVRASELAADNRLLVPALRVTLPDGSRRVFADGFWPIDLNVIRATDMKWAKQALRDIPTDVIADLSVGERRPDGTCEVRGHFASPKAVRSVEVLEGSDTVFMYDPAATGRTDTITLRVEIQARRNKGKSVLKGTIGVEDGSGKRLVWKRIDGLRYTYQPHRFFLDVPAAKADKASVVIDLEPQFKARVAVRDVIEREIVGFAGPLGGNLVVARNLSQKGIPVPCDAKDGSFSFTVKPADPSGVLRLQIVDRDRHVWRGCPRTFFRPSGRTQSFRVFERDEETVSRFTVDAARLTEPSYAFGAAHGTVEWNPAGRAFFGMTGGSAALAAGFGAGPGAYGDSVTRYLNAVPMDATLHPKRVTEPDGRAALEFSGSQYLMLPKQLVSRFAAFEISLDVQPGMTEGVQSLVDTGNAGYRIRLVDGVPQAELFDAVAYIRNGREDLVRACGPKLRPGVWQSLRVVFDQRTLTVFTDGVAGEPVPASLYLYSPRYTAVGAANRGPDFFWGRISNLKFKVKED